MDERTIRKLSRRCACFAFLSIVVIAAPASAAASARTLSAIRAAYAAEADRFPCGEGEGDPPLRRDERLRTWPLIREWGVAYLDRHPEASASALERSFRKLKPTTECTATEYDWRDLSARVVQLEAGPQAAYAVSVYYNHVRGTVFVLSRDARGTYRVAWTIADALASPSVGGTPDDWRYNIDSWEIGPLQGALTPLPRAANGHSRFQLEADSLGFAGMGCTKGFQLSMWEWDGATVRPLLMTAYSKSICDDAEPGVWGRWQDDTYVIRVKPLLQTMSPTGGAVEPRGSRRIRVTPDGVEDLGDLWDQPDLHFVDDVLDRVLRQRDTTDVIEASVAADLSRQLAPRAQNLPASSCLGSFGHFAIRQEGESRIATMSGGSNGEVAVDFTIVDRGGKPYVSAAAVRELQ